MFTILTMYVYGYSKDIRTSKNIFLTVVNTKILFTLTSNSEGGKGSVSSNRVSNNNGVLVTVLLNHILDGEASATLISFQQIPAPVCDGLLLKHMSI